MGKAITAERLADIFMQLQNGGAKNLNLVTASHYLPWVTEALDAARAAGFALPVVYNTGGYETVEAVRALAGYVDIWLTDYKVLRQHAGGAAFLRTGLPAVADAALREMLVQTGAPVYDADGYLQRGVIVRHLALPGHVADSRAVLQRLAALQAETGVEFIPSLMSQFTPFYKAAEHGLGRRITTYEYRQVIDEAVRLGLTDGYMQEKRAAPGRSTPRRLIWKGYRTHHDRIRLLSAPVSLCRSAAGAPGRAGRETAPSSFRWGAGLGYPCWRCCPPCLPCRSALPCRPPGWRVPLQRCWAVLLRCGTRLHGTAKDPDCGASWACLLPVAAVTLFLLHTHVLHMVNGTLHTGQSCYGDMPMHLGFIRYIAQSGEFPPRYPLLGGAHRFGYPFLCETVSSVFLLLGADLRTAYLLPMLPAFLSVYGMFWQLARRVTGSAAKASLAFYLFFMGSGFGFVYFLGSAADFAGIFTGFYTTPTNFVEKNIVWVNPIADLLIPQRATLFGWCVLPALYLLWRFCYEGERRLWLWLALLVAPLPFCTHSALALVLLCLVSGLYTLTQGARKRDAAALAGAGRRLRRGMAFSRCCRPCWRKVWTVSRCCGCTSTGSTAGMTAPLKDSYLWFYIKNIGLVSSVDSGVCTCQTKAAVAVRRRAGDFSAGRARCVPAQQL